MEHGVAHLPHHLPDIIPKNVHSSCLKILKPSSLEPESRLWLYAAGTWLHTSASQLDRLLPF